MAFDDKEKQIILWGRANGRSREDVERALLNYRSGIQNPTAPDAPNSVVKDLGIGIAKGAGSSVKAVGDMAAASAPNLILGPALSAFPGLRETLSKAVDGFKNSLFGGIGLTDENLKADNAAQKIGKGVEVAAEFATPLVATKLARVAPHLVRSTQEAAAPIVEKAASAITPRNTPRQAVAQIAQGERKSLSSVAQALETIDRSGVKTYQDFLGRIDAKIPELARSVDDELAKDTRVYKLAELATQQTTRGGKPVTTDYVTRALTDLAQMYKSIGDDVRRADIEEIIAHANANGLTRKEVNDISRVYGEEFGAKAFAKNGDPLTGTNAQAYETTRKGLKAVARQGLGGAEAQALDQKLASLYETRRLVQRNAEAVERLKQRIQERGLVEKAGYYLAKYADILTGGSIRGFVGGVLPRGAGYKTMNALDIEEALERNIKVIEKALEQNTDKGLLDILREADPVFKKPGPKGTSR